MPPENLNIVGYFFFFLARITPRYSASKASRLTLWAMTLRLRLRLATTTAVQKLQTLVVFYGAFAVTLVIGDQLFDNLLFNLDRDKMCNGLVVGLLGCCFAARLDY